MPKKTIDYKKTIIYKIVCKNLSIDGMYIGSTTDFYSRKKCHKSRCTNKQSLFYNYKIYSTIRENGGWENWEMLEIEKFPCADKREADTRERYWIEKLKAILNHNIPSRSKLEYAKIYNKKNIDKFKENYNKKKIILSEQKKCGCGMNYTTGHRSRHMKTQFHIKNSSGVPA